MGSIYITTSPIVTCILQAEGEVTQLYPELTEEFYEAAGNADEIITDSTIIRDQLAQKDIRAKIDVTNPVLKNWRMNRYQNILNKTGLVSDYESYYEAIRAGAMQLSFDKIKTHSGQKDELIAQVVHSIDDLQKVINLTGNRLQELYALHFPELVDTLNNQITLARIVADEPKRDLMTRQQFETISLPAAKIDYIMEKIDNSMGGDLERTDLVAIQEYAKTIIHTQERKQEMERWIDTHMEGLAPNLTAVAGANVGARLISAMGSLMDLAKTHASKVQIIGAEKALYASLRGKGTPPKHGIIFQIPEIGNAPYYIRGKLARSFANSIVIAVRLDVFDGEFKGDQMREELKQLEQDLREDHN